MPVGKFKNPVGGLSPLGYVAAAVSGTPVPLNTNVGAQSQGTSRPGAGGSNRFRQLIISADPANTQNVYLVWTGYAGPNGGGSYDSRYILDKIPPGVSRSYPQGSLLEHVALNIDNFVLDNDVNGEGAFCSVIYG